MATRHLEQRAKPILARQKNPLKDELMDTMKEFWFKHKLLIKRVAHSLCYLNVTFNCLPDWSTLNLFRPITANFAESAELKATWADEGG